MVCENESREWGQRRHDRVDSGQHGRTDGRCCAKESPEGVFDAVVSRAGVTSEQV